MHHLTAADVDAHMVNITALGEKQKVTRNKVAVIPIAKAYGNPIVNLRVGRAGQGDTHLPVDIAGKA